MSMQCVKSLSASLMKIGPVVERLMMVDVTVSTASTVGCLA